MVKHSNTPEVDQERDETQRVECLACGSTGDGDATGFCSTSPCLPVETNQT